MKLSKIVEINKPMNTLSTVPYFHMVVSVNSNLHLFKLYILIL